MRSLLVALLVATGLNGCKANYPEGSILCTLGKRNDCPTGWLCEQRGDRAASCYTKAQPDPSESGRGQSGTDDSTSGTSSIAAGTSGIAAGTSGITAGNSGIAAGTSGIAAGTSGITAGSSGVTAGSSGVTAGSSGVTAGSGGSNAGCVATPADPTMGRFVAPGGSPAEDCGLLSTNPCDTIAHAMASATKDGVPFVYLDAGSYAESVNLVAGVTLLGGWTKGASAWTRDCSANRATKAVIASPTQVGVRAAYDGIAKLDTLTVKTKLMADPNESLYGIQAVGGANTRLTLHDVIVIAADGGNGTVGEAALPPAMATGTCAISDGAAGTPDGPTGGAAPAGKFASSGYQPGTGLPGGPGVVGHAGVTGPHCYSCMGNNGGQILACDTDAPGSAPGLSGCGGSPGLGGLGGSGGGSSVALFVWGANVTVEMGALRAADGGSGGLGGAPSAGGPGVMGTTSLIPSDCVDVFYSTGGTGGAGSAGGQGGPGAGGFSYAVLIGGAGVASGLATAMLQFGNPGTSAGPNGTPGAAAEIGMAP